MQATYECKNLDLYAKHNLIWGSISPGDHIPNRSKTLLGMLSFGDQIPWGSIPKKSETQLYPILNWGLSQKLHMCPASTGSSHGGLPDQFLLGC